MALYSILIFKSKVKMSKEKGNRIIKGFDGACHAKDKASTSNTCCIKYSFITHRVNNNCVHSDDLTSNV